MTRRLPSLERLSVPPLARGACANDAPANDAPANDAPANDDARDPHVARAIAAMKADPARRWTVAALARVGGLSRAAFARRFSREMGTSPLRWLTEHRLRLAQKRLVETDQGLAGIAIEIGYESEFAFGKAFKRRFGIAPGRYRRRALEALRVVRHAPVRAAA